MATPIFPQELPVVSRFSVKPAETVLTDKEDGHKDFRQRSVSKFSIADVEWVFVKDDYSIYENFRRRTTLGAHKWFWIKLPSAGGVTWHVARFSQTKPSSKVDGHTAWTVSAQLEILATQSTEQPDPTPYPDLLGFKFYFKAEQTGG